jgi:hypothetical protein
MRMTSLLLAVGSLTLASGLSARGSTPGPAAPARVLFHQFTYAGQPSAAGLELAEAVQAHLRPSRYFVVRNRIVQMEDSKVKELLEAAPAAAPDLEIDFHVRGSLNLLEVAPGTSANRTRLRLEGRFMVQRAGTSDQVHDGEFQAEVEEDVRFRAGKPATDELYDRVMKAAVRRAALQVAWSIASWRQPLALSGPPDGDELSINHGAPFLAEGQGVRILRPVRGGDPEPVGLLAVTHVFDQWSRCRIEGGEPEALRKLLRTEWSHLALERTSLSARDHRVAPISGAWNGRWYSRRQP